MKMFLAAAVTLLVLVGVVSATDPARQEIEDEIRAVLGQYIEAIETEDLGRYGRVVANDAEMVNFGAFGDPIIGWEALRGVIVGQNAALDSIQVEQSQVMVHVRASGEDAWATSLWRFRAKAGGNVLDLPVRCTWQLQKRGETWQVVHFHKSIAAQ